MWVSRRSRDRSELLALAEDVFGIRISPVVERADNISKNSPSSGHAAIDVDRLFLDRDEVGGLLAALGDDERDPPLGDFVEQMETLGLEFAGRYRIVHGHMSIVILPNIATRLRLFNPSSDDASFLCADSCQGGSDAVAGAEGG